MLAGQSMKDVQAPAETVLIYETDVEELSSPWPVTEF
jgi:hypothetical protein